MPEAHIPPFVRRVRRITKPVMRITSSWAGVFGFLQLRFEPFEMIAVNPAGGSLAS